MRQQLGLSSMPWYETVDFIFCPQTRRKNINLIVVIQKLLLGFIVTIWNEKKHDYKFYYFSVSARTEEEIESSANCGGIFFFPSRMFIGCATELYCKYQMGDCRLKAFLF